MTSGKEEHRRQAHIRWLEHIRRRAPLPASQPSRNATAADSTSDSAKAETINLNVAGSANRSILVAAKNIYLHGSALFIPVLVIITVIVGTAGVLMSNALNATQPAPFDANGKDYVLDLAIGELRTNR